MDEDVYGDIADEDLIEIEASQASQHLPALSRSLHPAKRRRINHDDSQPQIRRRYRSALSSQDAGDSGEDGEDDSKTKKSKYKIHVAAQAVPQAQIIGATQADELPNSSPYRIRGPIYRHPRLEVSELPEKVIELQDRHANIFPTRSNHILPQNVALRDDEYGSDLDIDDIPSDAFVSPDEASKRSFTSGSSLSSSRAGQATQFSQQRLVAPQRGLVQTTLHGNRARSELTASQTPLSKVNNYIVDKAPEPPTHHALDQEALKTWVYPTNLGTIRDYQYSIVKNSLFNNMLVALPTGLGKTFIAATVMLNFFRWTKTSHIVFVAPTKPLVAQQVDACFNIVGIPKSQTTMLTGEQAPALRSEEWAAKRVFFMTPQTLHNDLSSGIADPKKIVLLVVDEAHRATGNYSYVTVVSFLRRFNKSFRVLALTATPGASVEAVQQVIDNLEISKVEIRTEESMDIQQFVHRRDIDQIILDPSDEINMVQELLSKALQPLMNQLCGQNAYWNRDPMALTAFGMNQARRGWMNSDAGRKASVGLKGMINALFSILASVAHSIKLLNFHGIGPFFSVMKDFRQEGEDSRKPAKYRKQILDSPDFQKLMERIQAWINKDDFIGHPKLTWLCDTILNHFLDAGEGRLGENAPPSATRVIVFSEYRDSAEEIARVLNRHGPMIRASVFVGQADSKRSEGMNQTKQIETIDKFKSGKINVIVATSIGEEGLDIGQVDLIVCYDASASPIRMLQRMGRTGRKRAGNIVLLLMRGKEEDSFAKAKDNYEKIQQMISSGTRFNLRHDLSARIVPRDIKPEVEKRKIIIPVENTQDPSLPEPRRRKTKPAKKPAKKFHMPDGVEMGFRKASKFSESHLALSESERDVQSPGTSEGCLASVPAMDSVLLSPEDEIELAHRYQNIEGSDIQEVSMPEMTVQTVAQRSLRPVGDIAHGQLTQQCVKLFKTLSRLQAKDIRFAVPYGNEEPPLIDFRPSSLVEECQVEEQLASPQERNTKKQPASRRKAINQAVIMSDLESEDEESDSMIVRGHDGTGSVTAVDTEREGDDLMHSEEPSEDESDVGSLKDFLANSSSQLFESQPIVRYSTSPPPARLKRANCTPVVSLQSSEGNQGHSSSLPHSSRKVAVAQSRSAIDSDDIVVPNRGRKDKRKVIVDSESDE